ncbi:MAG: hypothetical protein ACI8RD_006755 [Bacillariaceae sp.]|jgi:hypothetical protein
MQSETEKTPEMTDELEDGDWSGVLPPPDTEEEEEGGDEIIPPAPPIEVEENAEEKTNDDDDDLDIVEDTGDSPGALVEEETTVMPMVQPYKPRAPPKSPQEDDGEVPDFSQYKTNVAERLWRAKKEAEKLGATAGPDLVPLTKEYQQWRKKMGMLNKYIAEYKGAMHNLSVKRNQVNNINKERRLSHHSFRMFLLLNVGVSYILGILVHVMFNEVGAHSYLVLS